MYHLPSYLANTIRRREYLPNDEQARTCGGCKYQIFKTHHQLLNYFWLKLLVINKPNNLLQFITDYEINWNIYIEICIASKSLPRPLRLVKLYFMCNGYIIIY